MYYELAATSWGEEEIEALKGVIASGIFTKGEKVAEFERGFAAYHGKRHAVMTNSGSSANLLAVASLFHGKDNPLKRGDEVIVPAIAWSTTYAPLHQHGLRFRVVDVELETLNMDVGQLEAALTPLSKAVVGVSILGNPASLDAMRAFADRHGLHFMEDNCESLGGELKGSKTGTFGDIGTFSFFFSHQISTMEGGMVLTDSDELAHLTRSMRAHGWTRDLPAKSGLFKKRGSDHFEDYRFILPGYNVRPTELAGAVGVEQLRKLPAMIDVRRRNWTLFRELFTDDPRFIIQRENGRTSSFCFTIVLASRDRGRRNKVFDALREADIGFRMITGGCFIRHDVAALYDYDAVGDLPNACAVHDYGFFVGNQPRDLGPRIRRLREVLDAACG